MAIAYRYGVSSGGDAYLFLFNILIWSICVWITDLTVVLVPLAARIYRVVWRIQSRMKVHGNSKHIT